MDALACMSARTCPSCWHFRAGQCGLVAALREESPLAFPAVNEHLTRPLQGLASA